MSLGTLDSGLKQSIRLLENVVQALVVMSHPFGVDLSVGGLRYELIHSYILEILVL